MPNCRKRNGRGCASGQIMDIYIYIWEGGNEDLTVHAHEDSTRIATLV